MLQRWKTRAAGAPSGPAECRKRALFARLVRKVLRTAFRLSVFLWHEDIRIFGTRILEWFLNGAAFFAILYPYIAFSCKMCGEERERQFLPFVLQGYSSQANLHCLAVLIPF